MSYYHGIIVSILQTISFNIITKILPKIIHILELQVDKQKQFREESENKIVTSISPDIKNRQAFSDFILGQVKAASF